MQHQRTAVVTGASRGLGRRVAQRLSQEGFAVVIGYARDDDAAKDVVEDIRRAGGQAASSGGDLGDEVNVDNLFDMAEKEYGGVDVLVHAAGVLPVHPIADFSIADIDRAIRTNVRATVLLNRRAAASLRPGGSIVNFSSSGTRTLLPGYGVYAATKAALEALTIVMAREMRGRDVTVNAVAPGPTETDMLTETLAASEDPEAARRWMAEMSPLERIGRPDDIADVVIDLICRLRWINGQIIHTNGGAA